MLCLIDKNKYLYSLYMMKHLLPLDTKKGFSMKIHVSFYSTLVLFTCIVLSLTSCCPSGAWQDNFKVVYELVTDPSSPEGGGFAITGFADTAALGCGLWTVSGTSLALGPDRSIEFLATNPNPDSEDHCCYSYQFTGHLEGTGCLFIPGQYETNDGKCTQSGEMYLLSVR